MKRIWWRDNRFRFVGASAAIVIAALGLIYFAFFQAQPAHAAQTIPYKINFQGRLTDASGNPMSDGLYNIKFRIYDALTVGTLKWTENRIMTGTDNRIQVTNGLFNIQFGDVTALTTALFSGGYPLYLEVELPTPATVTCATNGCAVFTEGSMTPRQPLAASPYAFNADTIDGIDGASLVVLSPGSAQTGFISVDGNISTSASVQGATALFSGASAVTLGSTTNAGALILKDGTANNRAVTLNTTGIAASYTLTLPVSAPSTNQCLLSGSSTASQLIFGACLSTLQLAYDATSGNTIATNAASSRDLTITLTDIAANANDSSFVINIPTSSAGKFRVQNNGANAVVIDGAGINSYLGSGTNVLENYLTTGDTQPAVTVAGSGSINWGVGGSTATDTTLSRSATATLQTTTLNLTTGLNTGGTLRVNSTGDLTAAGDIIHSAGDVVERLGAGTDTFQLQNSSTFAFFTADSNNLLLQIGSATPDAAQEEFVLDATNSFSDSGTCGAATSPNGSLYYNGISGTVRACVNSSWEDLVSTGGLGLITFGVVADSGTNPGDIQSTAIAATATGPCKAYRSNTNVIGWTACTAYSGGRKVSVTAGTLTMNANAVANNYQHLCLTGSSGQPALSATGAETANWPTFSATSPVLCLADIRFSAANNTISIIYDLRVFTTSVKSYAYTAAGMAPGRLAAISTTKITNTSTTAQSPVEGVVGVTDGSTVGTNGGPNAILITGGQAFVKATAGTAGQAIRNGTTTGYADTVALPAAASARGASYSLFGIAMNTWGGATCTTQITCGGSLLTNIMSNN